jgi:type IV pilus assembly protein PilA
MFRVGRSSRATRVRGFTLIELLVVISIIAILAAIAFPVYNNVILKARKADALSTINNVKTALIAYQTEYNDWPPALTSLGSNATDARIDADAIYTSPGKWQQVYHALTATGDTNALATNNKRRMIFISFNPKQLDNTTTPTNSTTFLDPWGREFSIVIDSNGDNVIDSIPDVSKATGNMSINGSMAIWSYGPDPTKRTQWVTSWK